MPVNDGEVVKCVVSISMPDLVVAQNVYYYRLNDPTPDNPSDAQVVAAVDTAMDELYARIDDYMTTDVTVMDVFVDKVEWVVDVWETVANIGSSVLAIVGLLTGDITPHGVAAVVTALTARPQSRGRKFYPGFKEDGVDASDWDSGVITALTNAAAEWLTTRTVVGSAEIEPVILGQSGPSAGDILPLTGATIPAIAGYQRRRKPGVGS